MKATLKGYTWPIPIAQLTNKDLHDEFITLITTITTIKENAP